MEGITLYMINQTKVGVFLKVILLFIYLIMIVQKNSFSRKK